MITVLECVQKSHDKMINTISCEQKSNNLQNKENNERIEECQFKTKELRQLSKKLLLNDKEYNKFKIKMNNISMELNFIYLSFGLNIIIALFFIYYISYNK